MYLRVVSESLQPEEISARLGTGPDEATAIGSRRRPRSLPRACHLDPARLGRGRPGRPEDLAPVVLGWGPEFAAALGRLAGSGDADISLVMVQELTDPDDPRQKGIFLGVTLLAWLARAGASLDIDQVRTTTATTSGATATPASSAAIVQGSLKTDPGSQPVG